jgi:hypothetical protein
VEIVGAWLVHFFGCDYGAPYGVFVPYDFWSGVSGSFLVGLTAVLATWYAHNSCHASRWCLRIGRYPAAGGAFKLCHKHHPDIPGTRRPRLEAIERLHRQWKAGPT